MTMTVTRKIGPQVRYAQIHFCQACRRERVTHHFPSFYCEACRGFIWGWGNAGPEPEPEPELALEVAHPAAYPLAEAEVTLVLPALTDGRESVCGPRCAGAETLADLCLNCYSDHLID